MTPSLEVEDLRLGYDAVSVLSIDHWQVSGPGLHAVVGPNGSGKSTLLRVLGGYQHPLAGQIAINGEKIATGRLVEGVQYVPDRPTLLPRLTIADMAVFLDRRHRSRSVLDNFERYVAAFDLDACSNSFQSQLSRGQRRRCYLALALSLGNEILLLDEPLPGIDDANRRSIVDVLASEAQRRLIITATHDLGLIQAANNRLELGSDAAPIHA